MQHHPMTLFFLSPSHLLSKVDFCRQLWPGKEDASETLYRLISRLKPIIKTNNNRRIVADRGRAYELTVKEPAN